MVTTGGEPPSGRVTRSLTIAAVHEPSVVSTAELQLRDTGDVVLYHVEAGYPVWVQIAENCTSWEQWVTVAADELPPLGGESDIDILNRVAAAIGARDDDSGVTAHRRFHEWLTARGVPSRWAERINYD